MAAQFPVGPMPDSGEWVGVRVERVDAGQPGSADLRTRSRPGSSVAAHAEPRHALLATAIQVGAIESPAVGRTSAVYVKLCQ